MISGNQAGGKPGTPFLLGPVQELAKTPNNGTANHHMFLEANGETESWGGGRFGRGGED